MVDGADFWTKTTEKSWSLKKIQNSVPSTIVWRQSDIGIKKDTTIFTQKDNFWPFWMKIIVILWISSGMTTVTFFSAWDKSRDLTANGLNKCRPPYCIYCYWSIILKYQIHRVESRPGLEWWDFKSSAGPPPYVWNREFKVCKLRRTVVARVSNTSESRK